ncbi:MULTISPECIES: LysR family transcriptional regulator [unclassified Pseudomonas]|uniref:LysR family transcriptional regulator n=2 Tax=unclassified Pseudomonas TaxID=196821 RepID=UPI002AC9D18D|nr:MULTISPECIES: LysR family transcriptional regulator [unclassified Pseudomonas]MEB0039301.1 LysR family transcriptional regulator [Pseudomonas sp. MH10]MEB0119740.1 LysR family transcriptional regulator [Pseudomonas sp. CCI1.2]WPX64908.1 LysR family transcriptional regulator [Pseudomonas sp. MH10]
MTSSISSLHEPISAMGIKLVELETFLAVAECGSFSQAAESLHVTQPSVTSRVQRLESILGIQLLERTTRRVELTADGTRLAIEASTALRGLFKVIGDLRNETQLARQCVVIAATPMLAALTLPPVIQAYTQRYPSVQVELLDLQYPEALAALDSGAANFAVIAFEPRSERYQRELLWREKMVLVVPAQHPLAKFRSVEPAMLVNYPLMVIEQYRSLRAQIAEVLEQQGLVMPPVKSVGNLNTLLGMLDAGMGVTLLPHVIAKRNDERGTRIVLLEGLDLHRDFGIAYSQKIDQSTAVTSFCEFLRQHMALEAAETSAKA